MKNTVAFISIALTLLTCSCARTPNPKYEAIKNGSMYPTMSSLQPNISSAPSNLSSLTQGLTKSSPPLGSKLSIDPKVTRFYNATGQQLQQMTILNMLSDKNNRLDLYKNGTGEIMIAIIRPATAEEVASGK